MRLDITFLADENVWDNSGAIANAAGRDSDSSGCGLGQRDMQFHFSIEEKEEAEDSMQRIRDLDIPELCMDLTKEFRNYYKCSHCGNDWSDEWDNVCNDRCLDCRVEAEPYKSEDI